MCQKKFSTKVNLRIGLLLYMCMLLLGPEAYGLYNVSIDVVATVFSLYATFFFIAYLRSRKPADKHILNRQMLMNFYLKLLYYPIYYLGLYVGFQGQSQNEMVKLVSSTILSFSSTRIELIIMVAMYTLISGSRALHFICPAQFQTLNAKLCQRVSMLAIFILFAVEVTLSQVVYSPDKCDINESGQELHKFSHLQFFFSPDNLKNKTSTYNQTLSPYQSDEFGQTLNYSQYPISNETRESYQILEYDQSIEYSQTIDNQTNDVYNQTLNDLNISPKECTLFPTVRILLVLMVILEITRVSVAIKRVLKRQRRKRKVTQKTFSLPSSKAQSIPLGLTTQSELPTKLPTVALIHLQPSAQGFTSSPSGPHDITSSQQFSENPSIQGPSSTFSKNHTSALKSVSSACSIQLSQHANQDQIISIPEETCVSGTFTFVKPTTPGPAPISPPLHPFAPESSASPGDVHTTAALVTNDCGLPLDPHPVTLKDPVRSKRKLKLPGNLNTGEAKETLRELKNIIMLLMKRVYSLVIIFVVLYLVSFLLPIKLYYYLNQTWLQITIFKLDLFFVPVFWIFIDKDVFYFTKRKTKDIYCTIKMKFTV